MLPVSPQFDAPSHRVWLLSLFAVSLLAVGLRFYQLEHNPPGFWQDEVSTAVDAYYLWHKGTDRFGVPWPILAHSYGDYPFALYRYLDAPVVGLLGLHPWTERLPAALLSTLLVSIAALLAYRHFGRFAALATAISAAICPTWLHLARYGSEQILLPTLLAMGLLLVEWGRDPKRRICLWLGCFCWGLAAYSYHATKVLLPLWMLGVLVYVWPLLRELWRQQEKRHVLGPAFVFLIFVMPSVYLALTPEGKARALQSAAFYHMPWTAFLKNTLHMYRGFFDPNILFFSGLDAVVISPPGLGLWSWFDLVGLVLFLLGFIFLNVLRTRFVYFVLYWFLMGPVPGAVGYESASITRLIGWNPAPQILCGLGYLAAMSFLARIWLRKPILAVALYATFCALATVASLRVIDRLLVQYPLHAQRVWQYEILATLRCAKIQAEQKQLHTVVLDPHFASITTFAEFVFLPKWDPKHRVTWRVGTSSVVKSGEAFAFVPGTQKPVGTELCALKYKNNAVAGYVYGPPPH